MALNELTISLSDPQGRVSVETLTKALQNTMTVLRSMEAEIVARDVLVRWEVVRATMRSPLRLTVAPSIAGKKALAFGKKVVNTYLKGVGQIEQAATLPRLFNDDILEGTKELVETARKDGASVTLGSNHQNKITLTQNAVKHIDEIISKARIYIDFSTIEGRIEVVSVRGGLSASITEELTNYKIECVLNEDQLQQAKNLLGNRVAIMGRVRYRNHKPTTVHVENIRRLRESHELPQLETMPAIDITGGVPSEEYVRRMRDAR